MDIWDMLLGTDPNAVRQAAQPAQQMMGVNRGMQILGAAAGPSAAGIGNVAGQQAQEDLGAMERGAQAKYQFGESPLAKARAALEQAQAGLASSPQWRPLQGLFGTKGLYSERTGETKMLGGGGGGGGMTDEYLTMLAQKGLTEGKTAEELLGSRSKYMLPYMEPLRQKMISLGQQQAGVGNALPSLAGAKGEYAANTQSAKSLQKQADAMDAFENTALANTHRFLDTAKGVIPSDSPLWNAPAESFMQQVAGDPRMTAMNAARMTAAQEIAKVLSGSLGQTAVSDHARTEVNALLPKNASFAQLEAATNILERDMASRKASTHGQLADIYARLSGKKASGATGAPPGSPSMDPQDQAAMQWLQANPNHPKAASVKAKLQAKGLAQ